MSHPTWSPSVMQPPTFGSPNAVSLSQSARGSQHSSPSGSLTSMPPNGRVPYGGGPSTQPQTVQQATYQTFSMAPAFGASTGSGAHHATPPHASPTHMPLVTLYAPHGQPNHAAMSMPTPTAVFPAGASGGGVPLSGSWSSQHYPSAVSASASQQGLPAGTHLLSNPPQVLMTGGAPPPGHILLPPGAPIYFSAQPPPPGMQHAQPTHFFGQPMMAGGPQVVHILHGAPPTFTTTGGGPLHGSPLPPPTSSSSAPGSATVPSYAESQQQGQGQQGALRMPTFLNTESSIGDISSPTAVPQGSTSGAPQAGSLAGSTTVEPPRYTVVYVTDPQTGNLMQVLQPLPQQQQPQQQRGSWNASHPPPPPPPGHGSRQAHSPGSSSTGGASLGAPPSYSGTQSATSGSPLPPPPPAVNILPKGTILPEPSLDEMHTGRLIILELRRERVDAVVASRIMHMTIPHLNGVRGVLETDHEIVRQLCENERGKVVCTIVERCGAPNTQNVLRYILSKFTQFAFSQRGCIAIPRVVMGLRPEELDPFVVETLNQLSQLICDKYANYVVKQFASCGRGDVVERFASAIAVMPDLVSRIAVDKFGSYVLDEFIKRGEYTSVKPLLERIFFFSSNDLRTICCDAFGNYVVQSALDNVHRNCPQAEFQRYVVATVAEVVSSPYFNRIAEHFVYE